MEYILIGVVSAFNLLVIKVKLERKRYEDAALDFTLMLVLAYLFSGSYGGTVVAMVSSFAISIYLFFSPPKFTGKLFDSIKGEIQEIQNINSSSYKSRKQIEKFDL